MYIMRTMKTRSFFMHTKIEEAFKCNSMRQSAIRLYKYELSNITVNLPGTEIIRPINR